jgi:hypothetical protein
VVDLRAPILSFALASRDTNRLVSLDPVLGGSRAPIGCRGGKQSERRTMIGTCERTEDAFSDAALEPVDEAVVARSA